MQCKIFDNFSLIFYNLENILNYLDRLVILDIYLKKITYLLLCY